MILLLSGLAFAEGPEAVSTTIVQARPDMLGQTFVSGRETLFGRADVLGLGIEGYGDLAWPAGVDRPILPELYVLAVDGGGGTLEWTVGRYRLDLPTFGRMLDGGRLAWSPNSLIRLEAWAGFARHVGLDGLAAGAPVARVAATWSQRSVAATLGGWGELGEAPTFHADARLRWHPLGLTMRPTVSALASVALGGDAPVVERARVDGSFRPIGGVNVRAWGEHREVAQPVSALGQSILASFAPEGTNEAGVGVGFTDTRRDQLWVEGSVQTWSPALDADAETGLSAQVSWRPTCARSAWCLQPSWRAATGPGGLYHAFGTRLQVPLPEPVGLALHAMAVPYRKPHEDWDTAASLGASVDFEPPKSIVSVQLGGEVARDPVADFAPRGWFALRVENP